MNLDDKACNGTPPKQTDDDFLRWCESWKPCRYCGDKFIGPVCPCETEAL